MTLLEILAIKVERAVITLRWYGEIPLELVVGLLRTEDTERDDVYL